MKTCLGLSLLFLALSASAHDTWMLAHSPVVRAGELLSFQLTSGERFPHAGSAIAPERLADAGCRQAGVPLELRAAEKDAKSLRITARPAGGQSATCWVRLKPRTLDLKPDTVAHYLEEIDASDAVRNLWKNGPGRWRETYTKSAKALVAGHAPRGQISRSALMSARRP